MLMVPLQCLIEPRECIVVRTETRPFIAKTFHGGPCVHFLVPTSSNKSSWKPTALIQVQSSGDSVSVFEAQNVALTAFFSLHKY